MAISLASFLLHPENLREVKFKDNGLLCLVEGGCIRRVKGQNPGHSNNKAAVTVTKIGSIKEKSGCHWDWKKGPTH